MMDVADTTGMVIDHREAGKPGTHALIIGISDYPHLQGGSGPLAEQSFGLKQLPTAIRSALAFHDWLMNKPQLPVPLATCRLLLAPLPGERQTIPSNTAPAGTDDFVRAASAWRQDARRSEAEMMVFYFCGHKLQISSDDDILLCQNFGTPVGPSFRGAISLANIFNAMGQSDGPIAQTQLYFLDGSRHPVGRPDLGSRLYGTTDVFDTTLSGPDRRLAGVFHAAAPGDQAYAYVDSVSLFTEALIEGLHGAAAVPQSLIGSGENQWAVTIASLARWMGLSGDRLTQEHQVRMAFRTSLLGDAVIARIQNAPMALVNIEIHPAQEAAGIGMVIEDQNGRTVTSLPALLPHQEFNLPAGFYSLVVTPGPGSKVQPGRRLIQVAPPDSTVVVDVSV
jgi:hypothetical protein